MKPIFVLMGIIVFLVLFVIFMAKMEFKEAMEIYNDGIHKNCGGKWDLYSTDYIRNRGTVYHYKCLKCGKKFGTEYARLGEKEDEKDPSNDTRIIRSGNTTIKIGED